MNNDRKRIIAVVEGIVRCRILPMWVFASYEKRIPTINKRKRMSQFDEIANITRMVDALRKIEKEGDQDTVAYTYLELGRMLSLMQQGAAGLSLIQKAEQYFLNSDKERELMFTYMYLAMGYQAIALTPKYNDESNIGVKALFEKKAIDYINRVDVNKLSTEADKEFFNHTLNSIKNAQDQSNQTK